MEKEKDIYDEWYLKLIKNPWVITALAIGGAIGLIWVGGKTMNVLNDATASYKKLKNTINGNGIGPDIRTTIK